MKLLIMDSEACKIDIEKDEWSKLINIAQTKKIEIEEQKMAQVIVVLTSNEKIYSYLFDYGNRLVLEEEKHFLGIIKNDADTSVKKMVCLWSDGSVDFPSYSLREKMIETNLQNESTQILLNGYDGFIVKTIGKTMK